MRALKAAWLTGRGEDLQSEAPRRFGLELAIGHAGHELGVVHDAVPFPGVSQRSRHSAFEAVRFDIPERFAKRSVPRRLGQLLVDLGLGLVECQVEQLEPAEQVALDAVAGKDPPDGLLGLVERLDGGRGGARARRPAGRSPSPSSDAEDAPDRRPVGHRSGRRSTRESSLPFLDRQVALAVVVGRAERPEIGRVEERAGVAVVRRAVIDDEALGRAAVLAAPAVATLDGQDRPLPLRRAIARIAEAALRGAQLAQNLVRRPSRMPPHDEQARATADHRRRAPGSRVVRDWGERFASGLSFRGRFF